MGRVKLRLSTLRHSQSRKFKRHNAMYASSRDTCLLRYLLSVFIASVVNTNFISKMTLANFKTDVLYLGGSLLHVSLYEMGNGGYGKNCWVCVAEGTKFHRAAVLLQWLSEKTCFLPFVIQMWNGQQDVLSRIVAHQWSRWLGISRHNCKGCSRAAHRKCHTKL